MYDEEQNDHTKVDKSKSETNQEGDIFFPKKLVELILIVVQTFSETNNGTESLNGNQYLGKDYIWGFRETCPYCWEKCNKSNLIGGNTCTSISHVRFFKENS